MRLLMVGVNHRTAPLELREKIALSGDDLDRIGASFRAAYPAAELVVLSTCNRTELYVARPSEQPPAEDDLRRILADRADVALADLTAATILREDEQAVCHLFRVATGLESMVLGESEILGQVRRAYEQAAAQHVGGGVLHALFQDALNCAADARRQSGINLGRRSVGSVAAQFATQVFSDLHDRTVVALGAGRIAEQAVRHLIELKPQRLWVVSRSLDRACDLALRLGLDGRTGGARSAADLDVLLTEADVVLCATSATRPLITAQRFEAVHRKRRRRPLLLLDIAVPRNVEPRVGTFSNVYLYDLDDMQKVMSATSDRRAAAAGQCERLVVDAARATMSTIRHRNIGRLVRKLRQKLHDIGDLEHDRTVRKLLGANRQQADAILEEHTRRLINKILHLPLSRLDRRQAGAPLGFYAAALRRLFALDVEEAGPEEEQPANATTDKKPGEQGA
jgi:glutamyl-tRNA reductase